MNNNVIKIRGAKVHNLKNVNVDIPRNKLVVITGISGSGKSSLAFDTLYAEGQRRYVESLSAYARQFLGIMEKPNVEKIEGISPAIAIDQRKGAHNPRSTVGTITEIYDYLRLLFSRIGKPYCPQCGQAISCQTSDQILSQVFKNYKNSEIIILAPVVISKKGEHKLILEEIKRGGYIRVRIDGIIYPVKEALEVNLDSSKKHNIEIVVDSLIINEDLDRPRLRDSLEIALRTGKGLLMVNDSLFSIHFACERCGISLPELEPKLFSFNSPYGACPKCTGLGEKLEIEPSLIIPNSNLTIAEGAIIPWMRAFNKIGKQKSHLWQQLSDLADRYGFSLDEPIGSLSEKAINVILYGDGKFEGVIKNLERKHRETDSDWTRQEIEQYMIVKKCPQCLGKRLRPEALSVKVGGYSIDQISAMSIDKVKQLFEKFPDSKVSQIIIKEILSRCQLLIDIGLGYLTLNRKAESLAGGEEQRIKLAIQIGSRLTGVLYVLDEPSIGLHARDQAKLIATLKKLRDFGNTVVVVEHDLQTIKQADWIIDVGPGAGKYGGEIIFEGTSKQLIKAKTLTGQYLSGKRKIEILKSLKPKSKNFLTIKGAEENNLKNIDVEIPLGNFVCITGVSGSGKSSLMDDILAKALLKKFYRAKEEPGKHKGISGIEFLNKVVLVDQSPIGRTPRSNPATYTSAFSYIRELFTKTKEAKARKYSSSFFSFNVKGGRCETCEGQGQIKIEMYFLPDVYVECKDCQGKRYSKDVLEIDYKGKNIAEVLEMTVEEASEFFKDVVGLSQKIKTLKEVGLSYVQLGQPGPSLSGGEAQRIKLATELSRKSFGRTLYILDEPTTGLHLEDINKLIKVLRELVNKGNTVVAVEHNIDFIRCADWIIDLGPEGGDKGGYIVAQGNPEQIAKAKNSYTGQYLKNS
ncbi:MAG: excinuclease ABC subunit UvrA [bacterium]|nr:excinuclease ABC subunit UvrA [bacterium]